MKRANRSSFREALLKHKSVEAWKAYRPCTIDQFNCDFYCTVFELDGVNITGKNLVILYAESFPSKIRYSLRANLNRLLAECDIPQFSFLDQEVLKGFLLSAKSQVAWENTEIRKREFEATEFQFSGHRLKGRMLSHHVFVALENKKNGTYYSFGDYLQNLKLQPKLNRARSRDTLLQLFALADIKVRIPLCPEDISPGKLREILLGGRSEQDWQKWSGTDHDFDILSFQLDGYEEFSGKWLRQNYNPQRASHYRVKELFKEAKIRYNSEKLRRKAVIVRQQEKMSKIFENPVLLRQGFLGIMPLEDWAKPKDFLLVRSQRITFGDESFVLHSLMIAYCMYRYNKTVGMEDKQIGWSQLYDGSNKVPGQSSKQVLDEILNLAGIKNRWLPSFEDVDLRDKNFLRRILLNAEYNGQPISVKQILQLGSVWRHVRVKDAETGFDKALHSLVQYFTGYDFWQKHPQYSLNDVVVKMKKGKSSIKALNEVLEFAGF